MIPEREGCQMQGTAESKDNLEERVSVFIEGKHGRIGLIVPESPPSAQDWVDLHRTLAIILIRNAQTKNAPTDE